MAGLPLPLGSESQKIRERICVIFEEWIENNMSKAEILSYVHDKYLIPLYDTNREMTNPDLFIAYHARIRAHKAQPASPQEADAVYPSSQVGPFRAANAIENQNLQTSQQQPAIRNDFCQQVLSALGQIIKLLSDDHGPVPHPSATGSLKRKRVGEDDERGENEEAEKHIMEKEEGNDVEEAEKEGNDEEMQKKDEGDNGGLQKNERGDN